MKRRPLVGVALAVVGGMLMAGTGCVDLSLLSAVVLILLVYCLFWHRRTPSSFLVFSLVGLISACRFLIAQPSEMHEGAFPEEGTPVECVVSVCGFPRFYPSVKDSGGFAVVPVQGEGIRAPGGWSKFFSPMDVCIEQISKDELPCWGDRVWLKGQIEGKEFPGNNSYEFRVSDISAMEVLSASKWLRPVIWGQELRDAAAERLESGLEGFPKQQAVLKALVLGCRDDLSSGDLAPFKRTGAMHIFAISGLHVGIVGILLAIALKVLGVPRDRFALWLLPLLIIYVISTGMKASALRALSMAAVFILAPAFRCRADVPTSIAVAAIGLLYLNPLSLLSPGFIFSFGVVISIVMVYSIVPDTWLKGGWIRNYSVSLVITSFAASLVAIPLSALYFGTFSPISLVGNLLVVPLTFCIVLCGCLSLVTPWGNAVFNQAALVFVDLLLGSVSMLDRMPYSSMAVEIPPVPSMILWFGGLIYLLTHATSALQRRYGITSMICAVLLVLIS